MHVLLSEPGPELDERELWALELGLYKGGVGVQQAKPGLGRRSSGGWIVPVPSGKDSWSVEEGRLVRVKALNIEVWGRKHGPLDPVEPGGGVGGA